MKNTVRLGMLLVLCVGLVGCGNSADSLVKQQIDVINDMAEAVENGASQSEMEEIQERGEAINKKIQDLNLSQEEKEKLLERHKDEYSKATSRLAAAMMSKMSDSFKDMGTNFPKPNP